MTPEFSRPVQVDRLPAKGTAVIIEADEAERRALADRFQILAVDKLAAEIRLTPVVGGAMVRLHGRLRAEVRQACVISLVEVPQHIDEEFELTYGQPAADTVDAVVELDGEDPPDPIIDGTVDVGEAAAEQLALALDPYPRAPGAELPAEAAGDSAETHPFARLAALRRQ